MCRMAGHVYLVDGGVQNDHAQQGPLKVNTACWEGVVGRESPDYQPGLGCMGEETMWLSSVVTAQQQLYHGMLWQGMRHACMWWSD